MKIVSKKSVATLTFILIVASFTAAPVLAKSSASATGYSGRAIGVLATTPLGTLTFADTGQLPSQGGFVSATPVTVDTSVAKAQVLLSTTMGFNGVAESQAAVADVVLLPGTTNQITAEVLYSQSKATCNGVSGYSNIASLALAGQQITVSGAANQTVSVPGVLTLVINEQIVGPGKSITVNALDLTTVDGTRVVVSSASSDISCPPPTQHFKCPLDFVTAGGWISASGGKDSFGFHAGFHGDCKLSGHVEYIDHSNGIRVSTDSVTSYGGSGNTRTFSGQATVDGNTVSYTITAVDNGEPGAGHDQFSISLSNGYSASGTLGGGNIEIHT